jgi:predicted RNase H-like HicB family nuclease
MNMERRFDVVIERDEEGFYVASVPQLPGCHTQARSLDEVTERIREAIELCLEVEGVPDQSLEFVGIQRIVVAA